MNRRRLFWVLGELWFFYNISIYCHPIFSSSLAIPLPLGKILPNTYFPFTPLVMRNIKMQISFLFGFASLLFASLSFSVFSATPPTPPGYATGGLFSVYFQNMIKSGGSNPSGVCPSGYAIVGFSTGSSDYGTPLCQEAAGYWKKTSDNDLYYTGGKVFVWTNTGTADLSVSGSIAANIYYFNDGWSIPLPGWDTNFTWTWAGNNIYNLNTGNIGINKTTPTYTLDISGSLNIWTAGDFTLNNKYLSYKPGGIACSNNQILAWSGTLSPAPGFVCASDSSGIVGSGLTPNYMTKWNGTYLVNAQIFDNGTNIGIGTTSPTQKLDIRPITYASNQDGWLQIGTTNGYWLSGFKLKSDAGWVVRTAIDASDWSTSGTMNEAISIRGSGDVGIWTSSPSQKLHVNGNIMLNGAIIDGTGTRMDSNGGWFRTYGPTGWYSQTYGWGWYMVDATWIRNYGNKWLWMNTAIIGTNGSISVWYGWAAWPTQWAIFSGSVGIWTSSPSQKLDVVGNVQATAFLYSSDQSLKKAISPLENSLEKLLKLNGYSFEWRKNDQKDIWVIAQEVEKVFPEIVHTDKVTGLKSVEYGNLTAPLIEAIREQQKQINEQQKEIESLKQQIEMLTITK